MNCPTCTALARLLHSSTWRCVHGHEFQGPRTASVPKCMKCGKQPRQAGLRFCTRCEKSNAGYGVPIREEGPHTREWHEYYVHYSGE